MKRIMRNLLTISILVIAFLLSSSGATSASEVYELELLGGAGYNYYSAMAVADALTKGSPKLRVSATQTTGPEMNVMESTKRKNPNNLIIFSTQSSIVHARLSVADFKGKEPITDLKWIAGTMWGHHAWVVLDPKIKTMKDLDGKTLATLPGRTMATKVKWSFEHLGVKPKIKPMGFVEQYDALRDGVVDGCLLLASGIPGSPNFFAVPPLVELAQAKTVYAVPWPKGAIEYMNAKILETEGVPPTSFPTIMPPGTIPTQSEPMEVYSAMVNGYLAKEAADEEIIYEITKTLNQNYYRLGAVLPDLASITPAFMVQLLIIKDESEIHPGALRYYKEVGLWPRAWKNRKMFLE